MMDDLFDNEMNRADIEDTFEREMDREHSPQEIQAMLDSYDEVQKQVFGAVKKALATFKKKHPKPDAW